MSREICNECLGKQARDGKLSKDARERLVHRWRLFPGAAEHFRRDCRWWPKDGTPFLQRGIDFRTRIGEAGASQITMLWTMISALLVALWAPFLLFAQTVVTVDVALILTALTPIIVAVGVIIQMFVARKAAAATQEIHVLVNSQRTEQKKETLIAMEAHLATLELSKESNGKAQTVMANLRKRIASLTEEIEALDQAEALLAAEAAKTS